MPHTISSQIETTISRLLPEHKAKNTNHHLSHSLRYEINRLIQENQTTALEFLEFSKKNIPDIQNDNKKWEIGWSENLKMYESDLDYRLLAPLYLGKLPYLRIFQNLYKVETRRSERETFKSLECRLFNHLYDCVITGWIKSFLSILEIKGEKDINIIELGAGSCQHIPRINTLLKQEGITAKFFVYDWTNTCGKIAEALRVHEDIKIEYQTIDLKKPLERTELPKDSYIYTVNALEQISTYSMYVLNWLIASQPRIVIHFEPIIEVLDPNNAIDKSSIDYILSRDYLHGLYAAAITLESYGKLEIKKIGRSFLANANHENNSLLTWVPSVSKISY